MDVPNAGWDYYSFWPGVEETLSSGPYPAEYVR